MPTLNQPLAEQDDTKRLAPVNQASHEALLKASKAIAERGQPRTFFGMEYPFTECARVKLLKLGRCLDCSVRRFCEAPEKESDVRP